jgi:tripartite-type tricarboxylate transporter receptor subunit TctC
MKTRQLRKSMMAAAAAGLCLAPHAHPGFAQTYPTKVVRLVPGFAAGGAIDVFSQPLAQKLSSSRLSPRP